MPHYIEFTTDHRERTLGNPVHDGRVPRSYRDVEGVRVDGETVDFVDETIPDKLHRYLIESKKLRRRRIANDCVAFVAMMNSVELKDRNHNPFRDYDESVEASSTDYQPLVLVQGFHDGVRLARHVILPAHLTSEQNYLHKLGDDGPLCMSDLQDAMNIFGCTAAHPVRSLSL